MRRRDFLKAAAVTTLALSWPRRRFAHADGHDDKLWLFFDAKGAWDPTYFCDPHAHPAHTFYDAEHILTTPGGLRYAPWTVDGDVVTPYEVGSAGARRDFFVKHEHHLLMLRGLDTETNGHDVGPRHVWGGFLNGGYPSFGALLSATRDQARPGTLPLAFLSTGGFDQTNGMVPVTRLGRVEPLLAIARPNKVILEPNNQLFFHHPDALTRIAEAQDARTRRLAEELRLPYVQLSLARLRATRASENALAPLLEALHDLPSLTAAQQANPLIPQVQVTLAAMQVGVCASANLSMTGFDTHSNHASLSVLGGHRPRIQELLEAIDYALTAATDLGLYDRMVVMAGSDFGRSVYNGGSVEEGFQNPGKDHWPITSMMFMGPHVGGGRVLGRTSIVEGVDGPVASSVAVADGQVAVAPGGGGTHLRPVHVHHAIRTLAGIEDHPLTRRYPVLRPGDEPLPLFPEG